jgi:hypothetical protein
MISNHISLERQDRYLRCMENTNGNVTFIRIQAWSRPALEILEELNKGMRENKQALKFFSESHREANKSKTVLIRCILHIKHFLTAR